MEDYFQSPEWTALLEALGGGRRLAAQGAQAPQPDPDKLLNLARHHRVVPALYAGLCAAGRAAEAPEPLRAECRRNAARMLALGAEWARLHRRFASEGIRCLTLKGPALALLLYGDMAMRTCKDLDLLVPREEFERTEALLLRDGYVRMHGDAERGPKERGDADEHHVSFVHPARRVQLEIHWRLSRGIESAPEFGELWARGRRIDIGGVTGRTLGKEDLLLYLLVHGAEHGWFRLRWLLDIERLLAVGVRWEEIARLMPGYRCEAAAGQAAILLAELLGAPVPREMRQYARSRRARALAKAALPLIASSRPAPELPAFIAYSLLLKSGGRRLRYMFYPNARDRGMIPLPERLHVLYFGLRPLLWCWRTLRRFAVRAPGRTDRQAAGRSGTKPAARSLHGALRADEGDESTRLFG